MRIFENFLRSRCSSWANCSAAKRAHFHSKLLFNKEIDKSLDVKYDRTEQTSIERFFLLAHDRRKLKNYLSVCMYGRGTCEATTIRRISLKVKTAEQ